VCPSLRVRWRTLSERLRALVRFRVLTRGRALDRSAQSRRLISSQ
jgi:hypothetical protein